ncbi:MULTISPECIES: hypothetical protein [unclassified Nonomuraea]|uniref:hypothetical protein n=1 Tax=unclassified Nonomuraea TaxID=2593643 RepID=UPI0033DB3D5C
MTNLVGLLTVLVRSDLPKDVELLVLRHETRYSAASSMAGHGGTAPTASNCVIVSARPPPSVDGSLPGRPATILRWPPHLMARKWTFTGRRRTGLRAGLIEHSTRRLHLTSVIRIHDRDPLFTSAFSDVFTAE